MKKYIFAIVLICSSILCSCSSNTLNKVGASLSEIRQVFYVGETDTFKATFMCGKREKDYVINGYNTDLIDFGVVTITLKKSTTLKNPRISMTANTNRYESELEENPFDGTYVCDLKLITNVDGITLKIYYGSKTEQVELKNISSAWKVDCNQALKVACKQLKSELKPLIDTEFKGETYVKIIEDTKVNKGNYYWYVTFVGRNGVKHTVIIDPSSGNILAKS